MKVWIFQDKRQVAKLGEKKAPWHIGWYDRHGVKRQKKIGLKTTAKYAARKLEGEIAADLVSDEPDKIVWGEFCEVYRKARLATTWQSGETALDADGCLRRFGESTKVGSVRDITTRTLTMYATKRREQGGKKKGSLLSPETLAKELRTLKAALNWAVDEGYLKQCPKFPKIAVPEKEKPYVREEHFLAMLKHCDAAKLPQDQHYPAEAFWQALLMVAWTTGLRKSAMIELLWDDLDWDSGRVLSRYHTNKGKRDQRHHIGPALPYLERLFEVRKPGDGRVFPWNHSLRSLDRDLHRIQESAGIRLQCREEHEHTETCHLYGFHAFRYAHATYNAGRVSDRELQEQMGHRSFNTTKHYIRYAEEHQKREYDVYVPPAIRRG